MKRLISFLLMAIALITFGFATPALAGDIAGGAKVFSANCTACHAGGGNIVMGNKTLKKAALSKYLDKYNNDPAAAITYQVLKGKGAMPTFKGRLSDKQIEDVVAYVIAQSEKDWKK